MVRAPPSAGLKLGDRYVLSRQRQLQVGAPQLRRHLTQRIGIQRLLAVRCESFPVDTDDIAYRANRPMICRGFSGDQLLQALQRKDRVNIEYLDGIAMPARPDAGPAPFLDVGHGQRPKLIEQIEIQGSGPPAQASQHVRMGRLVERLVEVVLSHAGFFQNPRQYP